MQLAVAIRNPLQTRLRTVQRHAETNARLTAMASSL